jgi:hypothetical protein
MRKVKIKDRIFLLPDKRKKRRHRLHRRHYELSMVRWAQYPYWSFIHKFPDGYVRVVEVCLN